MKMNVIKKEKRLCACCMNEHTVKTVLIKENSTFKNRVVEYDAFYMYCDKDDELYMDENQIRSNDRAMKNAYRIAEGLLTSDEIIGIRAKYDITQSDMCKLLGWGGKTITRYESYQVQDRAHDCILKKISSDPEWFLCLLNDAKSELSYVAYEKYFNNAKRLIEANVLNEKQKTAAAEAKVAEMQTELERLRTEIEKYQMQMSLQSMDC